MTVAAKTRLELLARGTLAGDAMAWPNTGYRLRLLNPKRLARMEVLAEFGREHATTTPPIPYAHSSPVETLQPGVGEPTEWFAFAAGAFAECAASGDTAPLRVAWEHAAWGGAVAVRVGTKVALRNIRNGLGAPQSGNDNPHYFDDLPMVRATAAAAVFGEAESASAVVLEDAGYTGGKDGVWCAVATAALFGELLQGTQVDQAIARALVHLPEETWSRRLAKTALEVAAGARTCMELAYLLSTEVGDWIYSYTTVAPETFAFLIAHLSRARSADELLLGVLAQPRNAPTLPALAGAAAAVVFGADWIPEGLDLDRRFGGVGVAGLKGRSIREFLDGLRIDGASGDTV